MTTNDDRYILNNDNGDEMLLGCPTLDWAAIARDREASDKTREQPKTRQLVTNKPDDSDDTLPLPVQDWSRRD